MTCMQWRYAERATPEYIKSYTAICYICKAWASALCNIRIHESPLSDTQAIVLDATLLDLYLQATSELQLELRAHEAK